MSWVVFACLSAGLATLLVGGVFQAFSDFVMRGLLLAEPAVGIEAMQQINRTVLRSVFLATFLALVPISVALGGYALWKLEGPARWLAAAAAVVYLTTVFLVTVGGNVPMNERLDGLAAASAEAQAYWATYGRIWTRYNHVRTIGSVVAGGCFLLAAAAVG